MKYSETLKSLSDTELVAIAEELVNEQVPYSVIASQLRGKSNFEVDNSETSRCEVKNYVIDELCSRLIEKNVNIGDKTKKVGIFKKMYRRYLVG